MKTIEEMLDEIGRRWQEKEVEIMGGVNAELKEMREKGPHMPLIDLMAWQSKLITDSSVIISLSIGRIACSVFAENLLDLRREPGETTH